MKYIDLGRKNRTGERFRVEKICFNFWYFFLLDDKIFDPSWFKDILFKIKQKINALANPNEVRESFEVNQ